MGQPLSRALLARGSDHDRPPIRPREAVLAEACLFSYTFHARVHVRFACARVRIYLL